MRRFYRGFSLRFILGMLLAVISVACSQASPPAPTAPPQSPSVAPSSSTTTLAPSRIATLFPPTATPTKISVGVTATASSQLRMDILQFTTIISEDEVEPIVQTIRNLPGVKDVQTGGQELQVTYDPEQVSRKQFITIIEAHGFHVKE